MRQTYIYTWSFRWFIIIIGERYRHVDIDIFVFRQHQIKFGSLNLDFQV